MSSKVGIFKIELQTQAMEKYNINITLISITLISNFLDITITMNIYFTFVDIRKFSLLHELISCVFSNPNFGKMYLADKVLRRLKLLGHPRRSTRVVSAVY